MAGKNHSTLRLVVTAALAAIGFLPTVLYAQAPTNVVPVTAEPHHRVRFDNGRVRIYDVVLPKGESTLWHKHSADSFQVFFNASAVIVEPQGGQPRRYPLFPGLVVFSSTAKGPYTHRVEGDGDAPFRVALCELLGAPSGVGGANSAKRRDAPFSVALQNDRGRAYRLLLKPGESTGTFTRPANTAIFAISSGRISEHSEGKAPRLWDFDPGNFRWSDFPETLSLKNESRARVELVEIEVY